MKTFLIVRVIRHRFFCFIEAVILVLSIITWKLTLFYILIYNSVFFIFFGVLFFLCFFCCFCGGVMFCYLFRCSVSLFCKFY
eukprot:UN26769